MDTILTTMKLPRISSREDAGRNLAKRLTQFANCGNVIVLAIPTGSVSVAAEIALSLNTNLDVLLVGKITAPVRGGHSIGAVTCDGVRILNYDMIDRLQLSDSDVGAAILKASSGLARRERFYHGTHPALAVADHTVILVDDGTTPCSILRNAIRLLRRQHVDQIVVALPAACRTAAWDLRLEADKLVTLAEPATAIGGGKWFKPFSRSTAAGVRRLLSRRTHGTEQRS